MEPRMSLTTSDLIAIKSIVKGIVDESIETKVPPIVEHAIETMVPPMIEHAIEAKVPAMIEHAIEAKVPPMIERAIDNLSLQIGRGFNEVTENFKVVYQRLDRLEALTPNRH
jgi:phage gp29-like protein